MKKMHETVINAVGACGRWRDRHSPAQGSVSALAPSTCVLLYSVLRTQLLPLPSGAHSSPSFLLYFVYFVLTFWSKSSSISFHSLSSLHNRIRIHCTLTSERLALGRPSLLSCGTSDSQLLALRLVAFRSLIRTIDLL